MCDVLDDDLLSAAPAAVHCDGVFVAVPHPAVDCAHQQLRQLHVLLAGNYANAGEQYRAA